MPEVTQGQIAKLFCGVALLSNACAHRLAVGAENAMRSPCYPYARCRPYCLRRRSRSHIIRTRGPASATSRSNCLSIHTRFSLHLSRRLRRCQFYLCFRIVKYVNPEPSIHTRTHLDVYLQIRLHRSVALHVSVGARVRPYGWLSV